MRSPGWAWRGETSRPASSCWAALWGRRPEAAVHGLHEAGAVDAVDGDAAPFEGRAEEHQGGLGDSLAARLSARGRSGSVAAPGRPARRPDSGRPPGGRPRRGRGPSPAARPARPTGSSRRSVGDRDLGPTVLARPHVDRIGEEHLGDLFGILAGLLPDRRIGERAGGLIHSGHCIGARAGRAAQVTGRARRARALPGFARYLISTVAPASSSLAFI